MRKEVKQGSKDFQSFMDIFELYKELGTVEKTDEYWDEAVDKVNQYMEDHPDPVGLNFGRALMSILIDESGDQWGSRMITYLVSSALHDPELAKRYLSGAETLARKWFGGGEDDGK
jgi:hypothetical protein